MSGTRYGFIEKRKDQERRLAQSKIVSDFGLLLETRRNSGVFIDTNLLPYPKVEILGAFLNEIANADDRTLIVLSQGCVGALANYQDGVADYNFSLPVISDDLPESEKEELFKEFDLEAYLKYNEIMISERKRIEGLVNSAIAANPHIIPSYRKWWQRFRRQGIYSPFSDGFVDASRFLLKG